MGKVDERAREQRERTIADLIGSASFRAKTRVRAKQVDEACKRLDALRASLTISAVARTLADMYASDCPAASSIRNDTNSGALYRAIIDAWHVWRLATSRRQGGTYKPFDEPDISDTLLQQIRPDTTRMLVLCMRTELRNTRIRYQMLQSLTPDRLVRGNESRPNDDSGLGIEGRETVEGFLNPDECSVRGVQWAQNGQLMNAGGVALSRPGLKQALAKLLSQK